MKRNVAGQAETDILRLDVSDDALERAAGLGDDQRMTIGVCTDWFTCQWPQSPAERAAPQT